MRREQRACNVDRHISLSEVDAIGAHSQCDVDPVIDQDGDTVLSTDGLRFASYLEELRKKEGFGVDASVRVNAM